ncbi:hypothetical protein [Kinneretia aquatilis]|uniref:hypothetical protein n=1 Tax=Kinneretia aquatilis TaxID=2070761 RepID=UPI00149525D7|nr:hypothetical protein [Paucibacter aquatile]WIV98230.1 hypothetical protein K9V56_001600 [Paucibacter aquatile]
MELLDTSALLRMLALYTHVLACFAAAASVVLGDVAIFMPKRVDRVLLRKASRLVFLSLLALWVSGLVLIGIDTGFDLAVIMDKPKLLAKLSVVSILTLNGWALHRWAFPRLASPQEAPHKAAGLPALLGGVSSASWLFAAFLGVAKPLAIVLHYPGFMALYAASLALAIAIALGLMRQRLARQLLISDDDTIYSVLQDEPRGMPAA